MAHKKHGHRGHHMHGHGHADGMHQEKHGHRGMVHAGHHSRDEVEEGEMQGTMAGMRPGPGYYGAGANDFAGMPREVKMEQYPRQRYGIGVDYPDTYDAINDMQGDNDSHMGSQRSKEMY